jgi:hypothetical protein
VPCYAAPPDWNLECNGSPNQSHMSNLQYINLPSDTPTEDVLVQLTLDVNWTLTREADKLWSRLNPERHHTGIRFGFTRKNGRNHPGIALATPRGFVLCRHVANLILTTHSPASLFM